MRRSGGRAVRRSVVLMLLGGAPACGGGPALEVRDAQLFEAPAGATAAAYFTVVNRTDSADVLDSVTTTVSAAVTMHTQRQVTGFVRMIPLVAPSVLPRESLVFRPGGDHLMLEGVRRPLVAGEVVPLVLWFRRAGRIEVIAPVRVYGS